MGEVSGEYLKDFAWPIFLLGNHCCVAFVSLLLLAQRKKHKDHYEEASNQEETPCIVKTFSPSLFGTNL